MAVAVAASPLMPIGPARLVEPDPGVEVNLAVLGPGWPRSRCSRCVLRRRACRAAEQPAARSASPSRSSRDAGRGSAALLTRSGSVTGAVGVAMAFEPGRGRTAVPVRSALAGSVIAVAALTAAAVFGASLVALVSTPREYGQNWDAELDLGFGGAPGALGAQ